MATLRVTASPSANVHLEPNNDSRVVAILPYGTTTTSTVMTNNFYYLATYNGYIQATLVSATGTAVTQVESNPVSDNTNTTLTTTVSSDALITKSLAGIHGLPYQFLSTVDRRLEGTEFGRKYAEKIVGRMPLLFLTPGEQTFMSEFKKRDKKSVLVSLADMIIGNNEPTLDEILSKDGRYYTFSFKYNEYYKYVNPMAQSVAVLLGIGNETVTIGNYSSKLRSFDWSRALNDEFNSYFSAKENVVFYINASTSISESFSNDTRESSLVGTVNGYSDTMKEIQFLVGATTAKEISALNSENYDATLSSINSEIDKYLGGSGVLKSLSSGLTTVLSGGKLVFPELWSDSDFSTSYDIDIKLRSPDCDDLSIYLNLIIPYIHLIAMTAPRQLDANSYSAPFLVRAFYKGSFNVDMGVITSLSATRGKEAAWNDTGLPTEIDISMSIKDLYSSFFISNNSNIKDMVNNTALMDYLSNMAGVNLSQPEIERKVAVYTMLAGSRLVNMPNTIWSGIETNLANQLQKLYSW